MTLVYCEECREMAVENVDRRHQYTYEFSSSPEAHRAEYDDEEFRLTTNCVHLNRNLQP